jgi:hypothetical protein
VAIAHAITLHSKDGLHHWIIGDTEMAIGLGFPLRMRVEGVVFNDVVDKRDVETQSTAATTNNNATTNVTNPAATSSTIIESTSVTKISDLSIPANAFERLSTRERSKLSGLFRGVSVLTAVNLFSIIDMNVPLYARKRLLQLFTQSALCLVDVSCCVQT